MPVPRILFYVRLSFSPSTCIDTMLLVASCPRIKLASRHQAAERRASSVRRARRLCSFLTCPFSSEGDPSPSSISLNEWNFSRNCLAQRKGRWSAARECQGAMRDINPNALFGLLLHPNAPSEPQSQPLPRTISKLRHVSLCGTFLFLPISLFRCAASAESSEGSETAQRGTSLR